MLERNLKTLEQRRRVAGKDLKVGEGGESAKMAEMHEEINKLSEVTTHRSVDRPPLENLNPQKD